MSYKSSLASDFSKKYPADKLTTPIVPSKKHYANETHNTSKTANSTKETTEVNVVGAIASTNNTKTSDNPFAPKETMVDIAKEAGASDAMINLIQTTGDLSIALGESVGLPTLQDTLKLLDAMQGVASSTGNYALTENINSLFNETQAMYDEELAMNYNEAQTNIKNDNEKSSSNTNPNSDKIGFSKNSGGDISEGGVHSLASSAESAANELGINVSVS